MGHSILVTGASGALGPHLLAELLRSDEIERVFVLMRPGTTSPKARLQELRAELHGIAADVRTCRAVSLDRLVAVAGDVCQSGLGFDRHTARDVTRTVGVIVHAAANTGFTVPWLDLHATNVEGTSNVLDLGRRCRHLQQLLFVSTSCVAGTRTGEIPERLETVAPDFVNPYELSKWEAERLAARSSLPVRIVRLSTCIGGERTGYVHRLGAIHHVLYWIMRGLIPMVPGRPDTRVDLIATDVAARWIARAAMTEVVQGGVYHVAAGWNAPVLYDLLECVIDHLQTMSAYPNERRIERPLVVDAGTFAMFRRSVEQTGDRLLNRVLSSTDTFLPGLLYPKVYETRRAEAVWGGPLPLSDWRTTVRQVIDFGRVNRWYMPRGREARHALCHA